MTELCLGTVQFGMDYGITNKDGRVDESVVKELLRKAQRSGITFIDTAQAYGCAEEVLGKNLPKGNGFKLISKARKSSAKRIGVEDVKNRELELSQSLQRLQCDELDTFLIHDARELRKPGGEYLSEWLVSIRQRGLAKRIGVSIYEEEDLDGIDQRLLDVVQIPSSLLDQRLWNGKSMRKLVDRGTAIHARSIFLQGLLVTSSKEWPSWIPARIRSQQERLEELAVEKKCQLIDLAIGFAKSQEILEAVVVGICNKGELEELLRAWAKESPWEANEWAQWGIRDMDILDPRKWPRSS